MKIEYYKDLFIFSYYRNYETCVSFESEQFKKEPRGTLKKIFDGTFKPSYSILFLYNKKRIPPDILLTDGLTFIVSKKVVDILEEAGLTGWSRYDIQLLDKYNSRIEIENYVGF